MTLISCCINADTRQGYKNESSAVGDYGQGSLQGVRSSDFLIEGVKNKMAFFRGYDCQCILYIDRHEDISPEFMEEIKSLVYSYGNNSQVIFKEHDRKKYKWYDYITLEALKLAEGGYVVHFDNDANAFRTDDCDIVERYFKWLDEGDKYICQPWDGIGDRMYHASTRFFICKRETLDFPLIERSIPMDEINGVRNPCLEFSLGALAHGSVLYPPREDDKYIVFSWVKYFQGTLKRLNEMKPEDALKHIFSLPFGGPNDVIDKKS